MNGESRRLLEKATHAIHAAEVLLSAEEPDSAAGRAYYACFYVAKAFLADRGLHSHKHSGVHALFGEHFAKPGFVDPKFHRILLDAFESRLQADYGVDLPVPAEQAAMFIDHAREFLLEANKFFGS